MIVHPGAPVRVQNHPASVVDDASIHDPSLAPYVVCADHRFPEQFVGENAIVARKVRGLEVRFNRWRRLSGIGCIRKGGSKGNLNPDAVAPAALQKVDERATLLCPVSWVVAVLNVDQVKVESGDFGEIGLYHIRIVLVGFKPALSVETAHVHTGNEARPVIDSSQEDVFTVGDKGPVHDMNLLIRLASQGRV